MTKTKVVIYCRVSSKEQENSGYSLEAQEKLLAEYANDKKFQVMKVFKIAESASGKQLRVKFYEVLDYVRKNKIPIILVEKIDRLTRNLKDAAIVQDWASESPDRQIHFVKDNFIVNSQTRAHENLIWDMKVAIARFYTNTLSEEVRKGQAEKVAQGWLPTKPPLGYKVIGEKRHKIIAVDQSISHLIKKMFELYSTGNYSVQRLNEEMFVMGLRQHSGKKIPLSRLHKLLAQPFYYGKIFWGGNLYQGKHEPLISKELFDLVQSRLNRKQQNPHYTKHNQLFKSLAYCESCRGTLTWEFQKGAYYGHCNNTAKYKACIGKTYLREDKAEEQIMAFIDTITPANEEVLNWISDVIKDEFKAQTDTREIEIGHLNKLLQKLRERRDKYYEARIDKEIPLEYCTAKIAECDKEEEVLLESLKKAEDTCTEHQQLGLLIHEIAYKAKTIYRKATIDEKRLLFSQIITNFAQNRSEIRPNWNLAGAYLSKWIPVVNKDYELKKAMRNGLDQQFDSSNELLCAGKDSNLRSP